MGKELTRCSLRRLRSAGPLLDIEENFECGRAGLHVPTRGSSYFAGCRWHSRHNLGVLRLDGEV
jgi:hypothetical protein